MPQTLIRKEQNTSILVIAVGGAGIRAIERMRDGLISEGAGNGLPGVFEHSRRQSEEYLAIDHDGQELQKSKATRKILINGQDRRGLGFNLESIQRAVKASLKDILSDIKDSDTVILTAGMGGCFGTAAVSIIADALGSAGKRIQCVVTRPFGFEWSVRKESAEEAIQKLHACVERLIIVDNDNLLIEKDKRSVTLEEAFGLSIEALGSAIRGCIDDLFRAG